MEDLYVGIVSYNPDLIRLEDNLKSISIQTSQVIVFDNGSNNQQEVADLISRFQNVDLLKSNVNLGIAAALNRLMQWGEEQKFKWMLSLDQDSVCEKNFVKKMKIYLNVENNIGIVAPVIFDRNVGVVGHNPKKEYAHVNTCITSGAITSILAWKQIGGYDEYMFIDSVDFDFCYRMRKAGLLVIQVKDPQLLHEIGNSRKRKFLFFNISVKGHSAFRKYYIARNNIYYPLKYHLWLHFVRGNIRNIWLMLIVAIYENNKIRKISAIAKGWKDGYHVGG